MKAKEKILLEKVIRRIISESKSFSVDKIFEKIHELENVYEETGRKCRIIYTAEFYDGIYDGMLGYDHTNGFEVNGEQIKGTIQFESTDEEWLEGYGLGSFRIREVSDTTKGFGPLLYEILLEKACEHDSYLISDRHTVSDSAKRVWQVYHSRQDVLKKQLDINSEESADLKIKQLTPDDVSDDTSMDSAIKDKGKEKWFESPLAKAYYKEKSSLSVLNYLRNSDKIDFEEIIS